MNYKFLLVSALFVSFAARADWLDDLATQMTNKKSWDSQIACNIMDSHIKETEAEIEDLQSKIDTKNSGVMSTLHSGAYQAELKVRNAELEYLKKVKNELKELDDNKKDRQKFMESLLDLGQKMFELEALNKAYEKETENMEKAKLMGKIGLKKPEVEAKKLYIKSTFFLA